MVHPEDASLAFATVMRSWRLELWFREYVNNGLGAAEYG